MVLTRGLETEEFFNSTYVQDLQAEGVQYLRWTQTVTFIEKFNDLLTVYVGKKNHI